MPAIEMYQSIVNPDRVFYGRAEYVEYLRVRQRERQAWARLEVGRSKALDRLHRVRECQDWFEVNDFINDHARDIDLLTDGSHEICDFKLEIDREEDQQLCWRRTPVKMGVLDDESPEPAGSLPAFKGRYQHRYRREAVPDARGKAKAKRRDRWSHRERYDLEWRSAPFSSHTDVLEEIGIFCDGGGGGGLYRYSCILFTQDFDHLRVMMRLAA